MKIVRVTTKTDQEIATAFDAVFKTLTPKEAPLSASPEQRLAPYRKHIQKLRRRGFTWGQIAEGMHDPRIDEKITAALLKKVFEKPEPQPAAEVKPPAPVEQTKHLFIDPATGRTFIR